MSDFPNFVDELSATNATLDYFADFKKASSNVSKIGVKLNTLNYLLGKPNLKESIRELYQENPNVFSVLNILVAVRKDNHKVNSRNSDVVEISSYAASANKFLSSITEYHANQRSHDAIMLRVCLTMQLWRLLNPSRHVWAWK